MFCSNCGEHLDENFRFCPKCGGPVEPLEPVQTEPVLPIEEVVDFEKTQVLQPVNHWEAPTPNQPQTEVMDPMPSQPQAEVAEFKKETKVKNYRRGPGRTILAVLVCIAMFAVSCTALSVMGMRSFTTEEKLLDTLQNAVQNLDTIPAAGFSSESDSYDTLMDAIIAFADENGAALKERDIQRFVEDSKLVEAVCKKLSVYITDIQTGSSDAVLDQKELISLLEKDRELIYDVMDTYLSGHDIENIAEIVDDAGLLEVTDAKELKRDLSPVYNGVRYGLSVWSVVALWAMVGLLVILLVVINRWSIMRTTGDVGITLAVSSAVTLVVAFFGPKMLSHLLSSIPGSEMIAYLGSLAVGSWLINCLIILGVGVVLILVSYLIKAISEMVQSRREAKSLAA